MFLKVSPVKGVQRFNVKRKSSPRIVGPYDIIEKINLVAYRLALPPELQHVHDVFHISQLRKYIHDATHAIVYEPLACMSPWRLRLIDQPMKSNL